jgi:hypothetical protein
MAERRSLAMSLTPEKMAFIHGAPVAPVASPEPVRAAAEVPVTSTEPPPAAAERSAEQEEPRTTRRRARRATRPSIQESMQAYPGLANLLVPLTTRLQPSTAAALKRAGLEQKLRGEQPATVQEIAEEAIQEWLRDNGYLA